MADQSCNNGRVVLLLGNQLFPVARLRPWQGALFFMAEDYASCRRMRPHQHKLLFTLSAMRAHAELMRREGFAVDYQPLGDEANQLSFIEKLDQLHQRTHFTELLHFETEDPAVQRGLDRFAQRHRLQHTVLPSPMFLCSRDAFSAWAKGRKHADLSMAEFYKWQRRQHGFLIEPDGRPSGGRWSFDASNRKALAPSVPLPELPAIRHGRHVRDLQPLVARLFSDHPGNVADFWLPTTRAQATDWLKDFLEQRFSCFGSYQEALTSRSDAVFHSALSPLLNAGLLTPREVISRALAFAHDERVALNSVEGFLRQVAGWREFVRGIYHAQGAVMSRSNFWGHERGLTADWYAGTTGLDPLDLVIRKAGRMGWASHAERLMVVGNLMLLCEIEPRQAYRWFMEMFVDSASWVTTPNVYGMALFADGGSSTGKPNICGSSYLLRMGDYQRGPWTETLDGLFWRFVRRHRAWFARQPRLAVIVQNLERIPAERRRRLELRAEEFLRSKTLPAREVA